MKVKVQEVEVAVEIKVEAEVEVEVATDRSAFKEKVPRFFSFDFCFPDQLARSCGSASTLPL